MFTEFLYTLHNSRHPFIDLKIYIHPVPRTALNKTKAGFYAYQTFLYIVAILVGSVDILVIGRWGPWNWENRKRLNTPVYWALVAIFTCLCLVVAGIVWTGGWTIAYILQSVRLILRLYVLHPEP